MYGSMVLLHNRDSWGAPGGLSPFVSFTPEPWNVLKEWSSQDMHAFNARSRTSTNVTARRKMRKDEDKWQETSSDLGKVHWIGHPSTTFTSNYAFTPPTTSTLTTATAIATATTTITTTNVA
jgi:hypothetical protein